MVRGASIGVGGAAIGVGGASARVGGASAGVGGAWSGLGGRSTGAAGAVGAAGSLAAVAGGRCAGWAMVASYDTSNMEKRADCGDEGCNMKVLRRIKLADTSRDRLTP